MTDPQLPLGPFTLEEARDAGASRDVLLRLERNNHIIHVHQGVYWRADDFARTDCWQRHVLLAHKLMDRLNGEFILAHESAAAVHGLWTPRRLPQGPAVVRLYTADSRNARIHGDLHVAVSPLFPGDVVTCGALRVTSIPRTAVDLARGMSIPFALVALDSALRLGATAEDLLCVAVRMKQWRGTKLLRQLIPLADARSESALESAVRGSCIAAGLPAPELQVRLRGASGRHYRVDLIWVDARLIVEPDGIGKYGASDEERRECFQREKAREDDLRAAGYRVLRATWNALPQLVAHVADHLRRNSY